MIRLRFLALLSLFAFALLAALPLAAEAPPATVAVARIAGPAGSTLAGTVTFTETPAGVHVVAELSGLPPGVHGLHVHAGSECVGDFTSAGGHFNPGGTEHGAPHAPAHHAGDFGNVEAGADGVARAELTSSAITVGAGEKSVVGHAVIVHANADDLVTQPTGNAGGRIGCGVVAAGG